MDLLHPARSIGENFRRKAVIPGAQLGLLMPACGPSRAMDDTLSHFCDYVSAIVSDFPRFFLEIIIRPIEYWRYRNYSALTSLLSDTVASP
jgi:hypothetical protein